MSQQTRLTSGIAATRSRLASRHLTPRRPRIELYRAYVQTYLHHVQLTTKSRPTLPFLSPSTGSSVSARQFSSANKQWLKHQLKFAARWTLTIWGTVFAVLLAFWALSWEALERKYPTPHGWYTRVRWAMLATYGAIEKGQDYEAARLGFGALTALEDPADYGDGVVKLPEVVDTGNEWNKAMVPHDISAKDEEWRRGYFEGAIAMAKVLERTEYLVLDKRRNQVWPPQFVVGPSNPRPEPTPAGAPPPPREEDCVDAYPKPEMFYRKLANTIGFSPRQQLELRLQEAAYWEYKGQLGKAHDCLSQGLKLAQGDGRGSKIEEWVKTDDLVPVRRTGGVSPSANMLDVVSAIADFYARTDRTSHALTAYVSLLNARRSLAPGPPEGSVKRASPRVPLYQKAIQFFRQDPYPAPPPDGFQAPWRSTEERCQEAALQLHIGEIMYAKNSREEGLAWTRDGVDEAELQMRALDLHEPKQTKVTCRECLSVGLENWTTMVARLAREERKKEVERANGTPETSWALSFWKGRDEPDGRWQAEEKVVADRVARTRELVEDLEDKKSPVLSSLFKA